MFINSLSPTALATSVWFSATRKLTSLANVMSVPAGGTGIGGALPPSANVVYRPAVNNYWDVTIMVTAGAAGSVTVSLTDGITTVLGQIVAAGASAIINVKVNNSVYLNIINNDAVNTVPLLVSGWTWLAA